jgi:hypothetical protein
MAWPYCLIGRTSGTAEAAVHAYTKMASVFGDAPIWSGKTPLECLAKKVA